MCAIHQKHLDFRQGWLANNAVARSRTKLIFLSFNGQCNRLQSKMASLICRPCQNDDLTVEAAGYCVDCSEYLCVTCYKYHCKPAPCRHHVLLDSDSMPRDPASHVHTETCEKHKGKVLEYFCNNHDVVGCSVCMTLDHTGCDGKTYIPDIASAIPDSDEYKGVQRSIENLTKLAEEEICVLTDSLKNTDKFHDAIVADVLCFRKRLDDAIDTLENVVRDEAQILKERNKTKLNENIKTCEELKSDIDCLNTEMNMSIKYRQFLKLFLAMKKAKQITSDMEERLNKAGTHEEVRFEFTPNLSILKLLNALETLGTVNAFKTEKITAKCKIDKADSETKNDEQMKATLPLSPKCKTIEVKSGLSDTGGTKEMMKITDNTDTSANKIANEVNLATPPITESGLENDKLKSSVCQILSDSHSVQESDVKYANRIEKTVESRNPGTVSVTSVQEHSGICKYMPSHYDADDEEDLNVSIRPEHEYTTNNTGTSTISCVETDLNPYEKGIVQIENKPENKPIESTQKAKESTGNTSEEKCGTNQNVMPVSHRANISNPKERVIVFLKDLDVTSSEDTSVPTVSGMACLQDDKIVVCDSENKLVKVLDILSNIVTQTIKSDQSPWDVCEAGSEKIAVTFPYSKQIVVYTRSEEAYKKDFTFTVDSGCYGIAYANDNLFVAFGDANVVKVLDLYGHVVRVLQNARGEKHIFSGPKHITAGPEGRLFYVANWDNSSVTCLTALGHVASIFTDKDLKGPRGLAVDSFGLVYICNYPRPSCIQVLTKGLNKVKKLLNKDKSIVNPLSLAYNAGGDWLFVGIKGEYLKMYKLTV